MKHHETHSLHPIAHHIAEHMAWTNPLGPSRTMAIGQLCHLLCQELLAPAAPLFPQPGAGGAGGGRFLMKALRVAVRWCFSGLKGRLG